MSTRPGIREVDGVLVTTARNVPPPKGWSNLDEDLGGDEVWAAGGTMESLLESGDVDATDMKPLYTMEPWLGGNLTLFEAGSPTVFYFFSPDDYTVHKISLFNDLQQIVDWINDDDKGYSSLQTERVI